MICDQERLRDAKVIIKDVGNSLPSMRVTAIMPVRCVSDIVKRETL